MPVSHPHQVATTLKYQNVHNNAVQEGQWAGFDIPLGRTDLSVVLQQLGVAA